MNSSSSYTFEYPTLKSAYPIHSRIRESIVRLFFCLCRQDSASNLGEISLLFRGILDLCFSGQGTILAPEFGFYIDILYRITLFTRDYRKGRGERQVSYCLMAVWFDYDLTVFTKLFGFFVNSYGGWRDAVGIASYVHSDLEYSCAHPLVLYCVEQINAQLYSDMRLLERGEEYGERKGCISNVAKWIPRENKKDGWMFGPLVENWAKRDSCHNSNKFSQKCKLYRKICSELNRRLGTFEIKLSGGNVGTDAAAVTVPLGVFSKYSVRVDKLPEQSDADTKFYGRVSSDYYCANYGKLVSELSRIMFFGNNDTSIKSARLETVSRYTSRIGGINMLWTRDMEHIRKKNPNKNILVVLDTGRSMFENGRLYDAIGIVCGLVEMSNCRRVLTVGHLPSWISFSSGASFSNMVSTLFDNIGVGSSKNIELTFDLLVKSFSETEMTDKEIENLTIVFVSDMEESSSLSSSIHSLISKCFHKKYEVIPHIVYWGIGIRPSTPLPCEYNFPKTSLISGSSLSLLRVLRGLGDPDPHFCKLFDPYTNICYRLRNYGTVLG